MEEYAAVMREKAQIFTDCIEKHLEKNKDEPINIYKLAMKYTLDTVCEAAMGTDIDSQRNSNIPYLQALHE